MILKILEEIHWVLRIACTVLILVWLGCQIFRIDDLETWIQLGEITYKYITFGPRELPGLEGKCIYEHNLFSKKGMLEMCWASLGLCWALSIIIWHTLEPFFFCVCGVHSDGDLVCILFTNMSTTLFFYGGWFYCSGYEIARNEMKSRENVSSLSFLQLEKHIQQILNSHCHWYFLKLVALKVFSYKRYLPMFFKKMLLDTKIFNSNLTYVQSKSAHRI